MRSHWAEEETGMCRVPGCSGDMPGTLLHIATGQCPGLSAASAAAAQHWLTYLQVNPVLLPPVKVLTSGSPEGFLSLLLDPSTQAPVISLAQEHGGHVVNQLCYLTRTWLFTLHKERLKKLGHWVLG